MHVHVVVLGINVQGGQGGGGVCGDGLALVQGVAHGTGEVGESGIDAASLVGQGQSSVINAGEVASSGGLATSGLEGEGVQVDASGHVGADGLVGLHLVEVRALAGGETVLAVQLQLGGVQHGEALVVGLGVGNIAQGVVAGVQVGHGGVLAVAGGTGLVEVPRQVLGGVVQVQTDVLAGLAGGGGGGGLSAGELQLLNQVLVGQLGEAGALLCVQEDVVNPHGHLGGGDGGGGLSSVVHVQAVHLGSQGEVELDLVVL